MLRRPEYRRALVFCGIIGIPVSLIAFWFLVLLHELENLIWVDWPHDLGWSDPPWWWPLPLALVSGAVVALVVLRFPGRGGTFQQRACMPQRRRKRLFPGWPWPRWPACRWAPRSVPRRP